MNLLITFKLDFATCLSFCGNRPHIICFGTNHCIGALKKRKNKTKTKNSVMVAYSRIFEFVCSHINIIFKLIFKIKLLKTLIRQ